MENKLILHNNDTTPMLGVIIALQAMGYSPIQAEQITLIAHHKGKCAIKEGEIDHLLAMQSFLHHQGLETTIE